MNIANKPVIGLNIEMKPVPGYDCLYAGEDGLLYKKISSGYYRYQNSLIGGYYKVSARIARCKSVHRLVYLAWYGPLSDELEIDHINGITTDNRPCNLEAVTHKENMRRAVEKGGCSSCKVRLTADGLPEFYRDFSSINDCLREMKIPRGRVHYIIQKQGFYHDEEKGVTLTKLPIRPCDTKARKERFSNLKQMPL